MRYTRHMSVPSASFFQRDLLTLAKFPLWWYGEGLFGVLVWMRASLYVEWRALGIGLWLRSFFRPMYGVTDLWGRAISVFARLFVILGRLLWWLAHVLVYSVALILWCVWIPFALALLFV